MNSSDSQRKPEVRRGDGWGWVLQPAYEVPHGQAAEELARDVTGCRFGRCW